MKQEKLRVTELLAPAGSYESFLGAIHAGADAVYLGGDRFGARAYAENFTEELLCKAIRYAHLFGRKVYLTLNTLLKQSELEAIPEFLTPFYLEGLDGVIVQDLGLFQFLKEHFPLLELHISTQMAVTGAYGVRFLKKQGAFRVVPARELSLEEIRNMKKEGLEIETFIHGAMCYCYSGQCFFSSFLGGRSGNRGKCAQPCRLPYQVNLGKDKEASGQKEEYPLSLKDMCSIELLPELVEAGIDSFKIEGRMKRPEYVAGVTSIYRKYLDAYYKNPKAKFQISEEDRELLRSLYIRSEIQDGYYHRHNGREMITLTKPSYSGMKEEIGNRIYDTYIQTSKKAEVEGSVSLKKGQHIELQLSCQGKTISCYGGSPEAAQKRPVSKEDIEKQLKKTGNTDFVFSKLDIQMEEELFLPLKELNELRREAFTKLEEALTDEVKEERRSSLVPYRKTTETKTVEKTAGGTAKAIHISVLTKEQCQKACTCSGVERLYVSGDLVLEEETELLVSLQSFAKSRSVYLMLPEILRDEHLAQVDRILKNAGEFAEGVLISNLETYGYLLEKGYTGRIALNKSIYLWNQESLRFWEGASTMTAPVECNVHEWKSLQTPKMEYVCYGRIPMMVTANCIRKTHNACRGKGVSLKESLTDRYQAQFPVQVNCNYCYNVIYNSVPLSLHPYLEQIKNLSGASVRLEFTTETPGELAQIVKEYEKWQKEEACDFSFLKEYTTGHYKKGAL